MRLSLAAGLQGLKWRSLVWGVAALSCIGVIAGGLDRLGVGIPALAQAPSPPDDAPVLSPGQRVRRPFGWLEISIFNRSQKEGDTIFEVDFLAINESEQGIRLDLPNFVRLIADGIPRAPFTTSQPGTEPYLYIRPNSAEYCDTKFLVRGRPHIAHVQFGTGDSGRSFLRWPE